jgi:hypothetical protein
MKSLGSTWVSRRRPIIILSAAGIASAAASALETTFHPPALHSHESCRRCARRRVSSRLRAAARRCIRARKRSAIRALEKGQPRYRQTMSCSTAVGPARWAGGTRARKRRAERMRRMEMARGRVRRGGCRPRQATSRWAQGGSARRREGWSASARRRVYQTSTSTPMMWVAPPAYLASARAHSRRRGRRVLRARVRDLGRIVLASSPISPVS